MYIAGRNKETKNKIYLQWCCSLSRIRDKQYLIFDNYFDAVTGRNIDTRPADAIMADIDEAMRRLGDGN